MYFLCRIISNYIVWVAIEDVIQHLPNDYIDARLAYKKRIHGQTYEDRERWDFCYKAAKTAFPMSIGLMFVDEKLDPGAKTRVGNRKLNLFKSFIFLSRMFRFLNLILLINLNP